MKHGDPRFVNLLERTNKTFAGGRLSAITSESTIHTALFDPGPDTSPDSEPSTRASRLSFLKRHSWKLGAAGFAIVLLVAAYAAGILVVNYDGSTKIMRQIPVKDVRFKLAFQNGKAAIRYMTVT